jgi:hypothetical protein
MPVRHGHDQDTARFDAVDDAEWKAPEQVSTCAVIEPKRQLRDSDTPPTMVGLDKNDALGLVDREPRGPPKAPLPDRRSS